jgi:hypothetical protein
MKKVTITAVILAKSNRTVTTAREAEHLTKAAIQPSMTLSTFTKRLDEGKANNFTYFHDGREGLVTVWKHAQSVILTWEECPAGEQYDESAYTRDERKVFESMNDLLAFLVANNLQLELFSP